MVLLKRLLRKTRRFKGKAYKFAKVKKAAYSKKQKKNLPKSYFMYFLKYLSRKEEFFEKLFTRKFASSIRFLFKRFLVSKVKTVKRKKDFLYG